MKRDKSGSSSAAPGAKAIDYPGRGVLDTMTDGCVALVGFDAKVVAANPKFCSLLGFKEDELVGRPVPFLGSDPAKTTSKLLDLFLDGGTTRFEKIKLAAKGGRSVLTDIQASMFRASDGQPVGPLFQFLSLEEKPKKSGASRTTAAKRAQKDTGKAEPSPPASARRPAEESASETAPGEESGTSGQAGKEGQEFGAALLQQINRAIAQELSLESFFDEPLSLLHHLIDHHLCGALVVDRKRGRLFLSSPLGLDRQGLQRIARYATVRADILSDRIAERGKPEVVFNKEQRRPPRVKDVGRKGFKSTRWLQETVKEDGEPIAVIFAARLKGSGFDPDERALFNSLTAQLSSGVKIFRSQQQLHLQRFDLVSQVIPHPIVHFDSSYCVDFLNQTAIGAFGKASDVLSMHISDLFRQLGVDPFDSRIKWDQPLSRVTTTIRGTPHEIDLVTFPGAGQCSSGGLLLLREKTAQAAGDGTGSSGLLQMVSGEIRFPISSAREALFAAMTQAGSRLGGSEISRLNEAAREIDRVELIVNEMVEFSVVASESVHLSRRRVQPMELLDQIGAKIRSEADQLGVRLKIEYEASVRETYADFDKVQHALINLLRFAMEACGDQRLIRIRCYEEKDEVHFLIGCPCRHREPAAASAGTDEAASWSAGRGEVGPFGVGVSTAMRIIDLHRGKLNLEAEDEEGAVFHVTLPILREEAILEHEVESQLSRIRRDKSVLSLILVKVNLPESIMEHFGRELLEESRPMVMEKIRSILRQPSDLAYLHGSGHLTAIVVETNRKGANALVRRIKAAFTGERIMIGGQPHRLSLRTGVACCPEEATSAKDLIQIAEEALRKKTVLLLSKESVLFKELADRLAGESHEVITTSDGKAAVKLARKRKPHLLITEIDTPGLSGYEVVGILKMNPETSEIPILIFSTLDMESSVPQSISAAEIPSVPHAAGLDPLLEKVDELL